MPKTLIFYSDLTVLTDPDPFSLEKRIGVQVIIQPDAEHNWVTTTSGDFYMWDTRGGSPQWFPGDYAGLILYLQRPGPKAVLIGEHVDKYHYRKILSAATERLGAKTGFNAGERVPHG